jgi:general secretion pathway protein E
MGFARPQWRISVARCHQRNQKLASCPLKPRPESGAARLDAAVSRGDNHIRWSDGHPLGLLLLAVFPPPSAATRVETLTHGKGEEYLSLDTLERRIGDRLRQFDVRDQEYATRFVGALLSAACQSGASDLHLLPTPAGLEVRIRIDGVLQPLGVFSAGESADVVTRLKVLADLLTYRTDAPQEGRLRERGDVEMRLSTFPTLYGEKAVVRLFAAQGDYLLPEDLGFPADVASRLCELLGETSGALLVTGPAGSGKTTTAYACLREIVRRSVSARSIATLEDPIEVALSGVAQSQVNPRAGFDLAGGLRSLLRQDPEVILVGEIRDATTAGIAFQAALTGQLVLTTFHAGSAAGAISRLSDMGVEPYMLRTGVLAVVCQRLVRRLCDCATETSNAAARLGLPVARARLPIGCDTCHGTGYRGRAVLVEMLVPERGDLAAAILDRWDAVRLEQLAVHTGMHNRWQRACHAVEAGVTSAAEVRRVLGFSSVNAVAAE